MASRQPAVTEVTPPRPTGPQVAGGTEPVPRPLEPAGRSPVMAETDTFFRDQLTRLTKERDLPLGQEHAISQQIVEHHGSAVIFRTSLDTSPKTT